MGVVMDGIAGTPKDSVYLLEFEFKWNGQALHAGRGPLYGKEKPLIDRQPDSVSRGIEVYDLSPFPIRYPEQLQGDKPGFLINFEPPLPIQGGKLNIELRLVSTPVALKNWLKNGVKDFKDDIGVWAERLAGPQPASIEFEIRKRSRIFKDSGILMEESSLGRYKLVPVMPTVIVLEIPAMQASDERYEIVFPSYSFSWERTQSRLPLNWLKGGPAPIVGTVPNRANPDAINPPKPKPSKPPFWQFWKRGE
jgi:hypothetical protein